MFSVSEVSVVVVSVVSVVVVSVVVSAVVSVVSAVVLVEVVCEVSDVSVSVVGEVSELVSSVVPEPSVGGEQPKTTSVVARVVRSIAQRYTPRLLISNPRKRSNKFMFGDDLLCLVREAARKRGQRLDDVIDSTPPRLRRCLKLHVRRGGFNPTIGLLFEFFRSLGISIRGASTPKELGRLLREHLRRKRLSERAACRSFNVNRTTLRRLLNGVPTTETQSLLEVCEKIGFQIRLGRGRFELLH